MSFFIWNGNVIIPQLSATTRRKCKRTDEDENHVKRPMNSFMLFSKHHRKFFIARYPDRDNRDISRLLAQEWNRMNEESKKPYRERARKRMAQIRERHPNFRYWINKNSTSPAPKTVKIKTEEKSRVPVNGVGTRDLRPRKCGQPYNEICVKKRKHRRVSETDNSMTGGEPMSKRVKLFKKKKKHCKSKHIKSKHIEKKKNGQSDNTTKAKGSGNQGVKSTKKHHYECNFITIVQESDVGKVRVLSGKHEQSKSNDSENEICDIEEDDDERAVISPGFVPICSSFLSSDQESDNEGERFSYEDRCNWVQCDICNKWRELPDSVDPSTLPSHWDCTQHIDRKYSSCSIPEAKYMSLRAETSFEDSFCESLDVEDSVIVDSGDFSELSRRDQCPGPSSSTSTSDNAMVRCRKRYGVKHRDLWCKKCVYKKKCERS